jgi:tRNA (guanine37-N1)-methyltransferase
MIHDSAPGIQQPTLEIIILTLFPAMFEGPLQNSIMGRACDRMLLSVKIVDFREFSEDKHHKVDDYPFGGGPGMVLKPEPLFRCLESLSLPRETRVILLSPQGETLRQGKAEELSHESRLVVICGHYEGIDDRVRQLATDEVSVGDYVLTGGEAAAIVLVDCVARLVNGVVEPGSLKQESFTAGLLEYPQYTRPRQFRDWSVPDVLLNGNHQAIERWRRDQSVRRTFMHRPDLLGAGTWNEGDRRAIDTIFGQEPGAGNQDPEER